MTANDGSKPDDSDVAVPATGGKPRTPAVERALAEAAARRAERTRQAQAAGDHSPERQGRGGLEPTRYGDWEVNGLAADF